MFPPPGFPGHSVGLIKRPIGRIYFFSSDRVVPAGIESTVMIKCDQLVSTMEAGSEKITKGEQTRRKIVAAAAPIFNQHGYEGSSPAQLMTATGLKKGGIYRHFSSKQELAAEAFDYTWQAARNARLVQVDQKAPGIEQLNHLIANFDDYKPPQAGGCPILNTAVDAENENALLRPPLAKSL